MYQEAPEQLERRISELQSQIDQLTTSLHEWGDKQDHLQPIERRLTELATQCAEIVERWTATGERHAHVVGELEGRLSGWNAVETRLRQEASERMRELQRVIEHEWTALRRIHEEPVKQLRDQATTLTDVSVAAASSAISGFERAESRLAELEKNLDRRLTELSEQMLTAVADLRAPVPQQARALPTASEAWPLEGVVRLHQQLRNAGTETDDGEQAPAVPAPRELPAATAQFSDRLGTLEQALTEGQAEIKQATARSSRASHLWWVTIIVLVVCGGAAAGLVNRLQQQVGQATARAVKAEQQTHAATEATLAANQQIAEARETAQKAQIVSDILAAPDLIRYSLVGRADSPRASGQVLWSRTRGLVLSVSRIPPPPANTAYQVWILTSTEPISAGLFTPDATGRYTLATDSLPAIPRPTTGVSVTAEPTRGSPTPTGALVLSRLVQ